MCTAQHLFRTLNKHHRIFEAVERRRACFIHALLFSIQDNTATLIDHIFVKLPKKSDTLSIVAGNILTDVTDHLPNFVIIPNKTTTPNLKHRAYTRLMTEQNFTTFNEQIDRTDWGHILTGTSTEEIANNWQTHLTNLFEANFPLKRISRKRAKDKPWITPGLKRSVQKKDTLYRKKIRTPTADNTDKYTKYRNILNSCLKTSEKLYYRDLLQRREDGIKIFWHAFGKLLNPNKKKGIPKIKKIKILSRDFVSCFIDTFR